MFIFLKLFFFLILLNNARADILETANKYTVKIKSSIEFPFYDDDAGTGKGAGFLIDKEKGWIFTNAHVSGRGNARVYVAFKDKNFLTISPPIPPVAPVTKIFFPLKSIDFF